MRTLVILSALLMSSAASAQFNGKWSGSTESCGKEYNDSALTISGNKFAFYEMSCQATDVRRLGQSGNFTAWASNMRCSGEGETFSSPAILTMDDKRRGLTIVMENSSLSFLRCVRRSASLR